MATKEGLRAVLTKVVLDIAEASGVKLTMVDSECPMLQIPGFDSLVAEDAVMSISDELGFEIVDPVFYLNGKPLSFGQILERLTQFTYQRLTP